MVTILFCGRFDGVVDDLEAALGRQHVILRMGNGCIRQNRPGRPDYLLLTGGMPAAIELPQLLLVLAGGMAGPVCPRIASGAVALVDSADGEALALAGRLRLKTVTVGLGRTDTLTCASHREEGTMLSLQRSIRSLSGRRYEPADIPMPPLRHPRTALLLGAILLLSDRVEMLKG